MTAMTHHETTTTTAPANRTRAARTLALTGLNHALHDGFTDAIYVLLPIWQTEFAAEL
jgi:FSR family fosmidomycin resistance protein-like MFS transporter